MKKKKIEWHIERRAVSVLQDADYNPRAMTEQEERDLTESIERFGMAIPGVINIGSRENILIGGHQRKKIATKQGEEWMDVMVPDRELSLQEEKEANLRFNKNTGHFTLDKLKEMDLGMLLDVGFGDEDLSSLWDDVDVIDDAYNVARAIKEIKHPMVKPGEVWQLGEHRLMCGDSTDLDQVAILMGEELADVLYLDPPYNTGVNYKQGFGSKERKQYRAPEMQKLAFNSDRKGDSKYMEFLSAAFENAIEKTKPNAHIFHWCDQRYIGMVQMILRSFEVNTQRVCIWIKNKANPTPQVAFNKVYEPCVYGTRGKPYLNDTMLKGNEILNKEINNGNQLHEEIMDLWLTNRDHELRYGHPTQKPVTLAERPLKRCSRPGHVVLDLFGGAGSTVIACEQIRRKCRMMEQDPVFATVIVDRWEQYTNQKATKI